MYNLLTRCCGIVVAALGGYAFYDGKDMGLVLIAFFVSLMVSYGVFDIKKESAE